MQWQPTATFETLRLRAELLDSLRNFFKHKGVMEVEVPILLNAAVTDPHIESMQVTCEFGTKGKHHCYLNTSPEYALKRLVCAGSGPIYTVARVFRDGEIGRKHNPEFTLLEWYRPGYSYRDLMLEVADLMNNLFVVPEIKSITYQKLFEQVLGFDPLEVSLEKLCQIVNENLETNFAIDDVDTGLELLMSHLVEPKLEELLGDVPIFVYDFPPGQAALANLAHNDQAQLIAQRFELYYRGYELANGYDELRDAAEQRHRFTSDRQQRVAQNLPAHEIDENFLAAIEHGMPPCAGVAIGVDRLVMLRALSNDISDVIAFNSERI